MTQRAAALAVLELNADVLLRGRLGFRTLLDVIPLDAGLVKGSHGRPVSDPALRPLFACESAPEPLPAEIASMEVCGLIQRQVMC